MFTETKWLRIYLTVEFDFYFACGSIIIIKLEPPFNCVVNLTKTVSYFVCDSITKLWLSAVEKWTTSVSAFIYYSVVVVDFFLPSSLKQIL